MGPVSATGAVFLSASVPDPTREHFVGEGDPAAISAAISALLYVVLGRRRLVWGGHPAITPMIWTFADAMGVQYRDWVKMYQTRHFEDSFPEENKHFENVVFTEDVNGSRQDSLFHMRMRMINETDFSHSVFIGGMGGLYEEFDMFVKINPQVRLIPVASTGGAAHRLAVNHASEESLFNELDYIKLFHRYLDVDPNERRYKSPEDQPPERPQRIVVPSKKSD